MAINTITIELKKTTIKEQRIRKIKDAVAMNNASNETPSPKVGKLKNASDGFRAYFVSKGIRWAANTAYDAAIYTYSNIKDDIVHIQELQNIRNITSKAMGLSTGIIAGGAAAGPVGMGIAAITNITSEAISMIQRNISWNMKQRENDIAAARASDRLGIVASSAGRNIRL